jgi:acyl carrier protein
MLLSCRVLGRGVEHGFVSWLGQRALKEGKQFVEFTYVPTGKNLPALEFITAIADQYRNDSGNSWTIPAQYLATVKYEPDEKTPIDCTAVPESKPELTFHPTLAFGMSERYQRLQQIGEELCDSDRLAKAIEEYRLRKKPFQILTDSTPGNSLETVLADIWKRVLDQPRIGINDNFFEVGGTSLKAVQVIALIKKELKRTLSMVSLFACPTVKLLAAELAHTSGDTRDQSAISAAALIGQQRRDKVIRRRVPQHGN